MEFSWSPAQQQRKNQARVLGEELGADIVDRDLSGQFSREDWTRLAQAGLQGTLIPEALGGRGLTFLDFVAEMEGLGESCRDAGLLFALSAQSLAVVAPLLAYGTPEQQKHFLPDLASGTSIGAFAMTESESGSSAFALCSRARREGQGFRLDGEKVFVTNGPIADHALIVARTSDGPALLSMSAFLVDLNLPGVQRGPVEDLTGLRTAAIGSLRFEDVELSAESLLGAEGAGASIFMTAMNGERIGILAASLGRMESQVQRCVDFARKRRLGGRPIREHQAVSHRIAEMRCRLEGARLSLYRAAWMQSCGQKTDVYSAQAKLVASEAAVDVAMDAIRIHGGMGLRRAQGLERELRDALMALTYSGTSDIQRNLIASGEGL